MILLLLAFGIGEDEQLPPIIAIFVASDCLSICRSRSCGVASLANGLLSSEQATYAGSRLKFLRLRVQAPGFLTRKPL